MFFFAKKPDIFKKIALAKTINIMLEIKIIKYIIEIDILHKIDGTRIQEIIIIISIIKGIIKIGELHKIDCIQIQEVACIVTIIHKQVFTQKGNLSHNRSV